MSAPKDDFVEVLGKVFESIGTMTPDIAAVIEDHRKEIGAQKMHVTLGPDATPEGVKEQLESIERQMAAYRALPETIRLRAEIIELKEIIRKVGKLAQTDMKKWLVDRETGANEELYALKSELFGLTDIMSIDIKVAMDLARKEGIID